ncbi:hypothetical protein ACQ5SP_06715 [Rhodovulum sp. YNF3179]|uniref:hypothetical protein n=1 Tax=Rhodovulum sp. YNF3179 TaxID=3425127 RepID=UPI003D329293
MTRKTNELPEHIAAALSDAATPSAKLADLIAQTEKAAAETDAAADEAKRSSLDPTLSQRSAEKAKLEADKALWAAERMRTALASLQQRKDEREAEEAEEARRKRYEAAKAKRDAAAKLIRSEYPAAQEALTKLISAIAVARVEVGQVNRDLPDGAAELDAPEGHAFGYPQAPHNRNPSHLEPPQILEMLVPDFKNPTQPVWPPRWNGGAQGRKFEQELDQLAASFVKNGGVA